jgi:phosphoglycolate phosphatase-like HAD superfamily hydrolase
VTLVEKLFGSNAPFNPVLGPECVKEGKPAPDMFLACAEAWRISPSEIVVVGDTPLDMDAGKRAGMKRIAVRWGYGDNNQLDACKPDYNVYKAAEIISLRP